MRTVRIDKVEIINLYLIFLFWPNVSKTFGYFFIVIQRFLRKRRMIALDNTEITEQLFKAVDTIVNERLRQLPYDKTIVATIIDIHDAVIGKYKVSTDNNIIFYAYAYDTSYQLDTKVYVRIPENDYTKQKIITGRYIPNNNNQAISDDTEARLKRIEAQLSEILLKLNENN